MRVKDRDRGRVDTYKRDVYTNEGTHPPLFPKMS